MKKLKNTVIAILLTLIIPVFAYADIMPHKIYASPAQAVEQTQMTEGNILTFKAMDEYKLTDNTSVEKDSVLTVRVKEYVGPKRGKRNGYLKINVESYTIPSEDNKEIDVKDANLEGTVKVTDKIDKKAIAEQAGVYAAELALDTPGLSQVYAASKGLIKPNEGETRLKSMGTNLYNSTGLQYIEKGQDMVIKEDSIIVISVK